MSISALAGSVEVLAMQVRQSGPSIEPLPTIGMAQPSSSKSTFADLVRGSLATLNTMQTEARSLQDAYERGEDVPLTDVVLAMQQSSLAFEATLQIRNKVLKAYEDVMGMPV